MLPTLEQGTSYFVEVQSIPIGPLLRLNVFVASGFECFTVWRSVAVGRVLFNTFIKGHVRKNEHREGDKERVKDRASASKRSA